MTLDTPEFRCGHDRLAAFVEALERMASGRIDERLPISPHHDALDAVAHGINVVVGGLSWAGARAKEAQEAKEAELRAAIASAEVRNGAILRAIPDLMFVLLRDGTYVDYHARDPKSLFAPPGAFIGKNVRDVLPPALAETLMNALESACRSDDPVVVEYELPMDEPHFFEARIVQAGADRLLSIVRDVTESKRASELNRELARGLIVRQEVERQRIARELHDDVSQRIALLNIEIDEIARQVDSEQWRARLRKLSTRVREIAGDLHHLSYELHPSRLRIIGLVAALQSLCHDTSRQRNLHVDLTQGTIPPTVDADISLCLYRIVQEALQNVVRHSHAREAHVDITCEGSDIVLRIVDSGVGFDPRHRQYAGLGLVSMRERVAVLKGKLTIAAAPGEGTQIIVRIPIGSQVTSSTPLGTAST